MLSLIDFGPFLALFFVAVSLSGSVSLLCCKSKKKSATKSQIQKQALVDSRKSKENIPLKEGPAPGEKPAAAAKGRQQKQLKTPPPQPAKGAAIGGGGAAGIRTAALFTPPKAPVVADPTKTAATKQPATPPKPAAPKPSDKSKKDVRAGVAVPDDDTVPDTKRMESKLIKMPEEMTRRRLDDPDYQTWKGLGNIFDASKRTKGDMGDGSLAKDPRSDSKSRLDTKSNLSSKSSDAANSKMDEEKQQAKSEGDNKKATTSQSKSSSKENNSQSTVRVTMTSETSINEENQQDNTKSEHDDNTKSEN
uniref:Candidate secreted effector n=1 Tax=Meloidogyne incognita TaxID=6306 RepID=A0A914NBX4_MELIC